MKVYYQIPDSDNELQNRMMRLLYDNFKLRILLAVQPIEKLTSKENGVIFIDRKEDSVELRYEGWSKDVEQCIRLCIAGMKEKQKIRFTDY